MRNYLNKNLITDIFFDLDHTLWDFNENSKHAFSKIFKIKKINLELEKFLCNLKKHFTNIQLNLLFVNNNSNVT